MTGFWYFLVALRGSCFSFFACLRRAVIEFVGVRLGVCFYHSI